MHRHVEENPETEQITIGTETLTGRIDETPCETCGERRIYHDKYDAFFCPQCNQWLEVTCGDPSCRYCAARPNRPLQTEEPA